MPFRKRYNDAHLCRVCVTLENSAATVATAGRSRPSRSACHLPIDHVAAMTHPVARPPHRSPQHRSYCACLSRSLLCPTARIQQPIALISRKARPFSFRPTTGLPESIRERFIALTFPPFRRRDNRRASLRSPASPPCCQPQYGHISPAVLPLQNAPSHRNSTALPWRSPPL